MKSTLLLYSFITNLASIYHSSITIEVVSVIDFRASSTNLSSESYCFTVKQDLWSIAVLPYSSLFALVHTSGSSTAVCSVTDSSWSKLNSFYANGIVRFCSLIFDKPFIRHTTA